MTLGEKQRLFMQLIGKLLTWVYTPESDGWAVTCAEFYRTPEQAALNAQKGVGISKSLHTLRLAADLNLFIGGVYQTDSEVYHEMGEYWESLHPLCRWGGRFSKPDGNHFSLEHEGVR